MAPRKESDRGALQELEKLLAQDLHEQRSPHHRRRRQWYSIGVRLAVYLVMIVLFYWLRVFATPKIALEAFLFFVLLEGFLYYKLDRQIIKFFRKRHKH